MTWTCLCPREIPQSIPVCVACYADRPSTAHAGESLPNHCDQCAQPTRLVQLTPGDDGKSRCASCHVDFLRRRAEADPISPEELARCRERLRLALARAGDKWETTRNLP